jgi:glycosyltransferase involved in cell wall biosynthesis
MRQIHVLQIIDGLNVGGAEVLLRDLVRGLRGERYRVSVCYSTPGPMVSEIEAIGVPMTRLPRLARVDPLLLLRMCWAIRRDPPQVVHTHLFKSDFHGRLAARICGVPVVVSTLHNSDAWAKNALFGKLYGATARFADRLIAVSEEVREFAIAHTNVTPDKVKTIPNGVPLQKFSGQDAAGRALRQELGIAADTPLIGIVGRLMPQKDHETFLQAAVEIRKTIPGARFLVVGDGPLRADLTARAASLRLEDAVLFCGIRKDIPAVMAAIDMLVFSSRWEGLPVTLLEGMAASRAVVATAVGGVPGVMIDGQTGVLVPAGEPPALARACVHVLGDEALRGQMGQAGRARVEAHYSIDSMVQQTARQYEEILSQRGLGFALQASSAAGER